MDLSALGKSIALLGAILFILGGLLWMSGRIGFPLGRLPGDIRVERGDWSCYLPILSMIVLSLLLTAVFNLIIRLLNR